MAKPLTQPELFCLQAIVAGKVHVASDCAPGVLPHLLQLGMVVQRPLRALPLGNTEADYVLTPAGRMALERAGETQ